MKTNTHAFIVRIWHEATDNRGNVTVWRGTIDHVGSENSVHFHDLDGITRFIQEQIGIRNKGSGPRWRAVFVRLRDRIAHLGRKGAW